MPLHSVTDHPPLPQRRPVPLRHRVLLLVVHSRIRRAIVHSRLSGYDHVTFQAAQNRAADDGRPGVYRLHHLHRGPLSHVDVGLGGSLAIGRGGGAGEVSLELAVEVVALSEATDEDDARDDPPQRAEVVDLTLDEFADFFDDGVEDFFDLVGCHDEEARVEAGFFVVGKAGKP